MKTSPAKKSRRGTGKIKKTGKAISPAMIDRIVGYIVDKEMGLREIAFRLNVSYAVLVRHLKEDPDAKAIIDEAREWTVFEVGAKLVEIADATTKDTLEVNRLRISARKDAVGLMARNRESIARSRPPEQAVTVSGVVGVVVVPPKSLPPPAGEFKTIASPEPVRLGRPMQAALLEGELVAR